MNLANDVNSNELKKAYAEFIESGDNSLAVYYNDLYINKFKVKDSQLNYLYNGDINFGAEKNKYVNSLNHQYHFSYRDIGIGDTTKLNFSNLGGYLYAIMDEDYLVNYYKYNNVVCCYKYLWFEIMKDTNLYVSVPNQGNINIDIYINDAGELLLDNNNV